MKGEERYADRQPDIAEVLFNSVPDDDGEVRRNKKRIFEKADRKQIDRDRQRQNPRPILSIDPERHCPIAKRRSHEQKNEGARAKKVEERARNTGDDKEQVARKKVGRENESGQKEKQKYRVGKDHARPLGLTCQRGAAQPERLPAGRSLPPRNSPASPPVKPAAAISPPIGRFQI
ncbi:MAG: hypothetical protein ABL893_18645 [Hyphomicrobium sp.]